ncbi:glycosyltransferase [Ahrensia marina]|uniref:Glycosyl transferase family 1 domain-containing protein n=1 Tax=Ahrensia marina TaxID=1514904 RepID=A0A0N0E6C8_9HYPH|nr:glycosyltransferase [Ahrensia marina]KPA99884.1 hypothetical protein SU32_16780 [Ahrensia marina]
MCKNILFVTNVLGPFLHHREHLVSAAREEGFSPIIMAMPNSSHPRDMDFEFHPVSLKLFQFNPISDMWFFLKILFLIQRKQPEVLHLVTIKPYLYGGLASRLAKMFGWRGKVVITVAGLGRLFSENQSASITGRAKQKFIHPFLVFATKYAVVFFETPYDKNYWISKGIINKNQARLTNGTGLNLEQFTLTKRPQNGGKIRVLFAGRLIRSKGLDVLMLAAKQLKGIKSIEFSVAGEAYRDDDDRVLPGELTQISNITYLGLVENMPSLLTETDIIVLASRYNEGVPRILIEGAACGCILTATKFPGSMALIKNGETGFFIEGNSIEEQAKHLSQLIQHLQKENHTRHKVGMAASEFVRNNGYSIEDNTKNFIDVYTGRETTAI